MIESCVTLPNLASLPPRRVVNDSSIEMSSLPERVKDFPQFRYMGSKRKLLPWIHKILSGLDFDTVADPFVGSGCVAYMLKAMGKRVFASDFLNFSVTLAKASIENSYCRLDQATVRKICRSSKKAPSFIERTFSGVFYSKEDLRFLDQICHNIGGLADPYQQALARAALIRSCLKKQPRGVFTITGNRYDDGRRDLRLSIEEHFYEQIETINNVVFDNGRTHSVQRSDVFEVSPKGIDLVYLDPPYVPRSDDNCYVKRYHFLEGLSCYWKGLSIMEETKVKKIRKMFTPFSYRHSALAAFDRLFCLYRNSTIVLSYSSNGFPDLDELRRLLRRYKRNIEIYERSHRYHFGTHKSVTRANVREYLIVGT